MIYVGIMMMVVGFIVGIVFVCHVIAEGIEW